MVHSMLYVGVDSHKATAQITVMTEDGQIIKRKRIETSQAGVKEALGGYDQPLKAVVEASHSWGPVYDWLEEAGADVILAHPGKLRVIAEARIKTDKIDSEMLARLLRADLIPAAHAPAKEIRAIKRVLRQRLFLVRVQTMVKNRIGALLSQHPVQRPAVSDLYGKEGLAWLRGLSLPVPDGRVLADDLKLLEVLRDQIASTNGLLKELAAGDPAIQWLTSLPGIGAFFSLLIRYEVDDIQRFRDAKKFAAYTGLVPSTHSSGSRLMHGPLTRQGNKWLRWAFIEAVTPAVTRCSSLRRYYEKIKIRRGTHDARTATARKLAELTWTVWTEQRCYEMRP